MSLLNKTERFDLSHKAIEQAQQELNKTEDEKPE